MPKKVTASTRHPHLIQLLVLLLIAIIILVGVWFLFAPKANEASINSFAECVADGRPIMESYPEQCAANGKVFSNPDQVVTPPQP